jgi:hypothetical protein
MVAIGIRGISSLPITAAADAMVHRPIADLPKSTDSRPSHCRWIGAFDPPEGDESPGELVGQSQVRLLSCCTVLHGRLISRRGGRKS